MNAAAVVITVMVETGVVPAAKTNPEAVVSGDF
jgi:hypothetical protein